MPLSILRVGLEFAKSQSAGQSHLNSDATIAYEGRPQGGEGTHKGCPYRLSSLGVRPWGGHPQGAPLPIVFSRRSALGRAPTRGAPTGCLLSAFGPGEGTHKGCPYRLSSLGALGRAPTRGAPTGCLLSVRPWGGHPQAPKGPGEGTHKGCPYRLSSLVFSRRLALGRAPTRGAPTGCLLSAFGPGEGTHKGRPYRLSSLGVRPWGGHPQGAPLPCLLSAFCPGEGTHKGRPYRLSSLGVFALGRAPTRGAPTDCLLSAVRRPWGGHPQGAPLPIVFSRRSALGRAPTRGAPTDCLLSAFGPGEGTHKGRPYRLSSLGVRPWGGHPQGVPLPAVFSRRSALGRAPTRGGLLSAPGEGTHKGCPYRLSSLGVRPWGGHPQGVPLPIVFSRRSALGRAPTRGAPTDCLLSAFGPGEGTHKGCPYRLSSLGVRPWGGHPQGGCPYPRAPTGCLLSAFCPGEGTHKGRPYPIQAASRGFF